MAETFRHFCHVETVRFVQSSTEQPNFATWETFRGIIQELKRTFVPNDDDLFLYFSGHGARANETTVVFGDVSHIQFLRL